MNKKARKETSRDGSAANPTGKVSYLDLPGAAPVIEIRANKRWLAKRPQRDQVLLIQIRDAATQNTHAPDFRYVRPRGAMRFHISAPMLS